MDGSMLTTNDIKEELSLAFVRAVACRAGFSVDPIGKDRDSIDVIIRARGLIVPDAALTSPALEMQLKATAVQTPPVEATFPFDLPVKNYNDLVPQRAAIPRLLLVYIMPLDPATWLDCTEDALIMRRSAYWHSLRGKPKVLASSTKRVQLSRANVFTPDSLRMLLERVAREEEL
jgi:Domain of unknown function (DUF4365)